MKKPKFKDRYVLGEGYPSVSDMETISGEIIELATVSLQDENNIISLKMPLRTRYWLCANRPKYRLVLERVK